jgi:hypothetical protein
MPALISGNCANLGAVNENGNGRFAGSAYTTPASHVPFFNLIGDFGEPVADGPMTMWPRGRYKEIKHTGGLSERQPGAEFGLNSLQFRGCSAIQQGFDASGARYCLGFACAPAEPRHAQDTMAEERMDRTRSIVMNSTNAIAVATFSILLAGLIRLKLCHLLLQTGLYRLALLQGKAEIVETSSIYSPFDGCHFPTLRNSIDPDKLYPDVHSQLRRHRVSLLKRPRLPEDPYPTFFPLPVSGAADDVKVLVERVSVVHRPFVVNSWAIFVTALLDIFRSMLRRSA